MKICCQCSLSKHENDFSKSKKYGLQTACKSCMAEYQRQYRVLKKEELYTKNKEYRETNKEKIALQKREWQIENKEYLTSYLNEYEKERRSSDVLFKLRKQLRSRLATAIAGNYKVSSAVGDLGCSIEELKKYLESKFYPGMTWDNWSKDGWHIDHIKPLASAKTPEEIIKRCHYSNLQPLWATDNLRKSDHE